MKVLTRLTWGSAKFWLGTIAVVAAALAMARDAAPTNAASTEILASLSSASPTWASSALLVKGGGSLAGNTPCVPGDTDPTTLCLYIWAKDVSNTIGAESFNVRLTYANDRITVTALTAVRTWLASTGHSTICSAPLLNPGDATVSCDTFLPPPPYWAMGSGILATVAVSSKSTVGSTTLDLSNGTILVQGLDPANLTPIPATVRSTSIFVAPCADFTGDGNVRSADITYVVHHYNTSPYLSSPPNPPNTPNPQWDPNADLDGSGTVKSSDILIVVKEYNSTCQR